MFGFPNVEIEALGGLVSIVKLEALAERTEAAKSTAHARAEKINLLGRDISFLLDEVSSSRER